MLGARLLVSAILIPAVVGLLYVDARIGPTAPVLYVLCVLIGLRCGWELIPLLKRDNLEPRFAPVAVCLLLLLTSVWMPHWIGAFDTNMESTIDANTAHRVPIISASIPTLSVVFGLCVMLLMTVRAVRFRTAGIHLSSLGAEVFTVAYVGLLLSLTAHLRWEWPSGRGGYVLLGLVIVATKMGDIGAYTLGRLFGRRKMSPYLSPGKTWMGALGAVIGGLLGAFLWLQFFSPWLGTPTTGARLVWGTALGAILAVAGLMGDLCESLIKRDVGVKDSASLMPGFGGLLDLVDSILFAGPIALFAYRLASGLSL